MLVWNLASSATPTIRSVRTAENPFPALVPFGTRPRPTSKGTIQSP
jgi:hypothetical protein